MEKLINFKKPRHRSIKVRFWLKHHFPWCAQYATNIWGKDSQISCNQGFYVTCLGKAFMKGHYKCPLCRITFDRTFRYVLRVTVIDYSLISIRNYVRNMGPFNSKFRKWLQEKAQFDKYYMDKEPPGYPLDEIQRWGNCTLEKFTKYMWKFAHSNLTMKTHLKWHVRDKHTCDANCVITPCIIQKYNF